MRRDRLDTLSGELIAAIVEDVTYGEPVLPETDLLLTGLVDSLGVIQIVSWLEDHLEMEIPPGDVVLEHFQTVDLMLQYVKGRA